MVSLSFMLFYAAGLPQVTFGALVFTESEVLVHDKAVKHKMQ